MLPRKYSKNLKRKQHPEDMKGFKHTPKDVFTVSHA